MTTRSVAIPAAPADATMEAISCRAELSPGSLLSRGARNELGYQVEPAACGAR